MSSHYKAFIVVAVALLCGFVILKPLFLRFMDPEDFSRRRNTWLALTATAFLVPNFWLYMASAAAVIGYAMARERNPAALYAFLLITIPPIQVEIPGLGLVNQIFPLDHFRLLSLVVLAPAAARVLASRDAPSVPRWVRYFDLLIVLYVGLQFVLIAPYAGSATNAVRLVFVWTLDILLPYFVVSRSVGSAQAIREVMACLALPMLLLAPQAAFEHVRNWLLYAGIGEQWGEPIRFAYLYRGSNLRAQATAGHSITLGYMMAVGLACWLYLKASAQSKFWEVAAFAGLVLGMVATFARGPWLGAAAGLLAFLALQPRASSRLAIAGTVGLCAGGLLLASPLGDKIIDNLPFVGSSGAETVTYRARLLELSMELIRQNPLFGSPRFIDYMEEMRQGQGIIDLVNTYATVALSSGLVGLGLFVSFFVGAAWVAYRRARSSGGIDPEHGRLGAAIVATLVVTYVVMATTSFGLALPYMAWSLAGLAISYARIAPYGGRTEVPASMASAPRRRRRAAIFYGQ